MATRTGRKIAHYAAGGFTVGADPTGNLNATGVPAAANPAATPSPAAAPTPAIPTGGISANPNSSTSQGLPPATPGGGYTPGPNSNAAGSWGASAETGGIAGDSSISPVGAPPAWAGGSSTPDAVAPTPALPAAAPTVYAPALPTPQGQSSAFIGFGPGQALPSPETGGTILPDSQAYGEKGGAIPDKVEHFAGGGRSGHGGYKIAGDPNAGLNEDNDLVAKFNKYASTHVSRRFTDSADTTANPDAQQPQPQQSSPQPPKKRGGGGGGGGGGQQQTIKGSGNPSDPGTPNPSGSSGWSGGLDSLPGGSGGNSTGSGSTTTSPSPGTPTDALGSQAYPPAQSDPSSSGAIPDGSTPGQGGVPTDAMGSAGTGGGISMTGGGGARGGRVTPKGIVPPEEPYRQKWRAKNGKKQAPYVASFAGGGGYFGGAPTGPGEAESTPFYGPDDPASQGTGNFTKDGSPLGPEGAEMGNPEAKSQPNLAEGGGIDPITMEPGWEGPMMNKDGTLSGDDPASMDAPPDQVKADISHTAGGGAIPDPDTADIPIDADQDQEGQTGDENSVYGKVKDVLSETRQMYGLTDRAMQMAGNMPTKPAGPGGDQTRGGPQDRSNPPPISQNDNNDQQATG